jgi:hypothetical protein
MLCVNGLRALIFPLFAVVAAGASGCEEMPPRGPVDLRAARVTAVELAPASGVPRICPGTDVPLTLEVEAVLPGDDRARHFYAQRRFYDDWVFDPREMHVTSPDGLVGDDLVLHTSADPLISATHGFLVNVRAPGSGPSFGLRYMPSYDCVKSLGHQGQGGQRGHDGDHGLSAMSEEGGQVGETGSSGGGGGAGPTVTMFATYVSTPYYPKLLAVVAEDGPEAFALANPGASLVLEARGGAGGEGGRGGTGGNGLVRATCSQHGRRGGCTAWHSYLPGRGGLGGEGGEGGAGGQLVLHVDARFPEIAHAVVLDVDGGDGGPGGRGGDGGEPGYSYAYSPGASDHESAHGPAGAPGIQGRQGPPGTATIVYDDVRPRFDGRPGITVLPST